LEDLGAHVDNNSAWETIRENINISAEESLGYHELKKHKSLLGEGCSKLLDKKKQAKLQWLQDPSEINWDDLNNVRHEYLKDKLRSLQRTVKRRTSDTCIEE
jgi:hypothetical protein